MNALFWVGVGLAIALVGILLQLAEDKPSAWHTPWQLESHRSFARELLGVLPISALVAVVAVLLVGVVLAVGASR